MSDFLNEIERWTAKVEVKDFQNGESLFISEYFFPEIFGRGKSEFKSVRNEGKSVVQEMTGQTVGKFLRRMVFSKGFFGLFKIKILENKTTAVVVEILRKQRHKKIQHHTT